VLTGPPNFSGSVFHTGAPDALAPNFANFNEIHKKPLISLDYGKFG
jgi:hypothetical protein